MNTGLDSAPIEKDINRLVFCFYCEVQIIFNGTGVTSASHHIPIVSVYIIISGFANPQILNLILFESKNYLFRRVLFWFVFILNYYNFNAIKF